MLPSPIKLAGFFLSVSSKTNIVINVYNIWSLTAKKGLIDRNTERTNIVYTNKYLDNFFVKLILCYLVYHVSEV